MIWTIHYRVSHPQVERKTTSAGRDLVSLELTTLHLTTEVSMQEHHAPSALPSSVPSDADPGSYPNVTSELTATLDGTELDLPGASDALIIEPEDIVEETVPGVAINQATGQADPTSQQPILFTAVFTEPVTGFAANDVLVSGSAGITATTIQVTETAPADGTTYEVAVSGISQGGRVIASIPAGVANGEFALNQASTSDDNTVLFSAGDRGDITPPVITLLGDKTIMLECPEPFEDPGATATDDVDESVEVIVGGDEVLSGTPGTYEITYDATDSSGNAAEQVTRTVIVQDTTAPVLSLNGPAEVLVIVGEFYDELGATATDECDPDVDVEIGGDPVDNETIGIYIVTYNATDDSGNKAEEITRTVKVIPRFASIVGLVGCNEVKVDKDSTINGSIGSQRKVEIKKDVHVTGDIIAVEEKAKIDKDSQVDGNIDAGDDIEVDQDGVIGGNVTSGEDIKLKKNASVGGDATAAGEVNLASGASVGGTITEDAAVPALPEIPLPTLSINAGGADVEVDDGETLVLAPGSYGELEADKTSTLILSAGEYAFEKLEVSEGSTIHFDLSGGSVIINVVEEFELDKEVQMTAAGGDASSILVQVQDDDVILKKEGTYLGTFLAPAGTIKLEKESTLTGMLVGEKVEIKEGCVVNGVVALDLLIEASAGWDGLLVLPLVGSGSIAFQVWEESYDVDGALGDDDLDGLTNVVEYVLAFDPMQSDILPSPEIDASGRFSWTVPVRPDLGMLKLVVEASTNMTEWENPDAMGLEAKVDNDEISVTGTPSADQVFLRVRVVDSSFMEAADGQ